MPICDLEKLVFLHCPKTGGTSIESVMPNLRFFDGKYKSDNVVPQHLSYVDLLKHAPEEMENYRKFTVVRNPWDRVVSDYIWHVARSKMDMSFLEFVKKIDFIIDSVPVWPTDLSTTCLYTPFYVGHLLPQYVYTGPGVRVLFFENLKAEFTQMCEEWSLNFSTLPHLNSRKHMPFQDFYKNENENELVRIILKHYRKDMERFGYPTTPY
jgi:hypothetical protein